MVRSDAALGTAVEAGVAELGQQLPAGATARLTELLTELARWNTRINLTAIREPAAMVSGHVLDSLAARPYLHGLEVIDIGTGAGFPGLPLAIVEPERRFVLLDSVGKKLEFVRYVAARLRLGNVEVVQSRVEDYAPASRFDTVIARALASIDQLAEMGGRLLREDGVLLALKGKKSSEELDALSGQWEYSVTELNVPGLDGHARHLVTLTKGSPT